MAVVSSCREGFSFGKRKALRKRKLQSKIILCSFFPKGFFLTRKKGFGKGVALSRETSETCAVSCYCLLRKICTLAGPLVLNQRKEQSTAGQYASNFLGIHAAYNAQDNGMQCRKAKPIS